jgi:Cu+-exporting ATPase
MDKKEGAFLKLQLEGIVCTGCAQDMETILNNTDGILKASVSFADGTVSIQYDPEVIDKKQVFYTVRKLGFKTKIIEG